MTNPGAWDLEETKIWRSSIFGPDNREISCLCLMRSRTKNKPNSPDCLAVIIYIEMALKLHKKSSMNK